MSIKDQLSLLYLSSPTLPIGSFAYSQGLEKAIDVGLVSNKQELQSWCIDVMRFGLSDLDMPFLDKIYDALSRQDFALAASLNDEVLASRETDELYKEELNLGSSLNRLLTTQGLAINLDIEPKQKSFLFSFAHAVIALQMSREQMLLSFLWSWLENQTAVACKAIPLGQTDAQAVLLAAREQIVALIDLHLSNASSAIQFGSLPGQALMSAAHETQYSRLFRS